MRFDLLDGADSAGTFESVDDAKAAAEAIAEESDGGKFTIRPATGGA
jgi:hypothetical protein